MSALIKYLSHSSSITQVLMFILVYFVCWNLETFFQNRPAQNRWKHTFFNSKFILVSLPAQFISGIIIVSTIKWTTAYHIGFLYSFHFIHKSKLLVFFISIISLDFGEYIYHRIMHTGKRLWLIHLVHHSDEIVDISTTLREHPFENIIRNMFTAAWLVIIGAPFWVILIRQVIQIFTTSFTHVNYRLNEKTDGIISMLFVTPNFHQVHHHFQKPFTNCNYGDLFTVWDRIFHTFRTMAADEIHFGVDAYEKSKNKTEFWVLMKIPFKRFKT